MSHRNQGRNWCSPAKRHRVHERDEWCCVWCGRAVDFGPHRLRDEHGLFVRRLATVDHVIPRCMGGSNDTQNLITACHMCNSERKDVPALTFAIKKSDERRSVQAILYRLVEAMTTPLPKRTRKCETELTKSCAV